MNAMTEAREILDAAKASFLKIGYQGKLFRDQYEFADILAPNSPNRRIELAVFAQEPPSYRSACFGFTVTDERTDRPEQLETFRALGAPQLLVIAPHLKMVNRWKVVASGSLEWIDQITAENLPNLILENRSEWNPEAMLRARSISPKRSPIQLDMFDLGLIPLIEGETQRKLDQLLRKVISSSVESYIERYHKEPDYISLFHLIFRFIAAKQLADRDHPGGNWNSSDPKTVISAVERYYFQNTRSEPILVDSEIQKSAWDQIRTAFQFTNISVETLAYVYENTLVSSETRKKYDVHATPPAVAEYIVQSLPIEELLFNERTVFEPFSGHAPFLTASLARLRTLLPLGVSASERHNYFVRMLAGMEIDAFAREIARNSLILADYPNPDGWKLINDDVFTSSVLDQYLAQASIVLCNPPYGDFDSATQRKYPNFLPNKAAEALRRVLQQRPKMLGFVLPRVFVDGIKFREERRKLASQYKDFEVIGLPETAFQHSDVETVLLLAHGQKNKESNLIVSNVSKEDYSGFTRTGQASWKIVAPKDYLERSPIPRFWYDPIQLVLDELADFPRLESLAELHRGIEFNIPFKSNLHHLVSPVPQPGFMAGLVNTNQGFEAYVISQTQYINVSPSVMRWKSNLLPWDKPKVVANKSRIASDRWILAAAVDYAGIVCYQNFHGIWPRSDFPLEVLAAILNGPIANAYLSVHRTSRDNQVRTVRDIPIPELQSSQIENIVSLVRKYEETRRQWMERPDDTERFSRICLNLMHQIDAEVLAAYDLTPRMERQLLDYFAGYKRPGPVPFDRYYPPGFRPAIPWKEYISKEFRSSSAKDTLRRLPVLHDPVITQMLQDLDS